MAWLGPGPQGLALQRLQTLQRQSDEAVYETRHDDDDSDQKSRRRVLQTTTGARGGSSRRNGNRSSSVSSSAATEDTDEDDEDGPEHYHSLTTLHSRYPVLTASKDGSLKLMYAREAYRPHEMLRTTAFAISHREFSWTFQPLGASNPPTPFFCSIFLCATQAPSAQKRTTAKVTATRTYRRNAVFSVHCCCMGWEWDVGCDSSREVIWLLKVERLQTHTKNEWVVGKGEHIYGNKDIRKPWESQTRRTKRSQRRWDSDMNQSIPQQKIRVFDRFALHYLFFEKKSAVSHLPWNAVVQKPRRLNRLRKATHREHETIAKIFCFTWRRRTSTNRRTG